MRIAGLNPEERRELERLLATAREEDGRDITSEALIDPAVPLAGAVVPRRPCRVAGIPAALLIAEDYGLAAEPAVAEGADVAAGAVVLGLSGAARRVLACERILLNCLGRLSGIATETRRFVEAFRPTPVYDTRKTTPGWRLLEKYAVRVGGGCNHRMSLEAHILVKDNHLAVLAAQRGTGAVAEAIERARAYLAASRRAVPIEVEVESEEDFRQAVEAGADIVMLDNWATSDIRRALAWLAHRGRGSVAIELSGGMTLERGPELSGLGADRVSVGAITFSAPAVDYGLDIGGTAAARS